MKTKRRKNIKKELEERMEGIKQIRIFGVPSEINYERGYIDCIKWVLQNLKNQKVPDDPLFWKCFFICPNDGVDYDKGLKAAIEWVSVS